MIKSRKIEPSMYLFLFTLTIAFISLFACLSITNYIKSYKMIYFMPFVLIISGFTYLVMKKWKTSNVWVKISFIFIIAFIIRAIVAVSFNSIPFNDFEAYLGSANLLAKGDIAGVASNTYYHRFPELLGFIIYEAILIKLFGSSLVVLRLVNCVISGLICVLIYIIGRKFNEKVGLLAALIYTIYPSQIIMTSVFSNQHMATLLYLITIAIIQYKIINSNNMKKNAFWSIIAGVILGIGNIIRPIAPPILIAILLYFILRVFKCFDKSELTKVAIVLLIPLSYVLVGKIYDLGVYSVGLTENIGPSSDIRYKFVVGLSYENNGQYDDNVANGFFNGNEEQRKKMFEKALKYNIKDPISFSYLVANKMNSLFSIEDASFYWWSNKNREELYNNINEGSNSVYEVEVLQRLERYNIIYSDLEYSFNIIVYVMGAIGVFLILIKSREEAKLLIWIFLGYVGAHCLIEVQPRYRYFIMPTIVIFAAYSITYSSNYIKNIKK